MSSESASSIVLDNAILWPGDGREFAGHIVVRDGRIETVGEGRFVVPPSGGIPGLARKSAPPESGTTSIVDLGGAFLSPGLIDPMLLGGFGCSVLREGPGPILQQAARIGVTSALFCGGTVGWARNVAYARRIREEMRDPAPNAARLFGWYPEGPFLDPKNTAALPEHAMPPTRENVRRMLDEIGDTFPLINVSPGLEGDVEAIRAFIAAGKVVSMAHSAASVEQIGRCLEAGTSVLGHFNCNNRGRFDDEKRRVPTIEEVALTDDRIRFIHVICDGVHTHDVLVRLCLRARGIEHVCVVTDAQPQAGCADGPFPADDGRTFVKAGSVARTTEGRLVGSTWMLPDQFRHFVRSSGMPPRQAIRAVTLNPATSLGLQEKLGVIATGRLADVAAWDRSLRIQRVWLGGREVSGISALCEVKL